MHQKPSTSLDAQYAQLVQIQYPNISVTANSVAVGERGKIYVVKATPPINKWQYILFFAHGNVFEMITMDVPAQSSYDEKVTMDLAGIADRKIIQKSVLIPSPITTIPTMSIPITDDDVYIENVENYFIQLNETMYGIISSKDSPELQSFKGAAELKILSKTYYNRIEPLKVSSKLELSKNSFLQYLTEMSIIADLQKNETSLFTMNEEQRKHSCNAEMFILNTFDSELCSVIVEKKQFLLPYCITRDVHSC